MLIYDDDDDEEETPKMMKTMTIMLGWSTMTMLYSEATRLRNGNDYDHHNDDNDHVLLRRHKFSLTSKQENTVALPNELQESQRQ